MCVSMRRPFLLISIAFGVLFPLARIKAAPESDPAGFKTLATSFFETHCLDCHESGTTKGGLNLEKADAAMLGTEQTDLWAHIFDRLASGEMPPPKEPRPARVDVEKLLAAIRPRLIETDRARREVVQRRLNRTEYENTIRDLLGIEIELKAFLPEDQQAGGFDNNGDALALSTEAMQGYLDAARAAVDMALVTGDRPTTETWTTDSLSEVQPYIDAGDFGYVDGRIVTYVADQSDYSKISTRAKRTPVRGRYRFQFQAATQNTTEPGFFTLSASNFAGVASKAQNLGYFEVGPEPRTFTIEAVLDAKVAVQFFALGLPGYIKKAAGARHPGVGFGPVEITGPLLDQWPPESTARLIGPVQLAGGTLADAETILRGFLPRAFRRPVSEAEVQRYTSLVRKKLEANRTFDESLRTGLIAVLCSPDFLYLREDAPPGTRRISNTELASRLSYFLWSSMPDAELLALAENEQLSDPKVLAAQVERLLHSGKAEAFVTNFTGQWLRLRQINDTTPDSKLYTKFDELLQVSMVREGEGFFREVLAENLPITNFLDSDWAMLNQRLAEHYGVPGVRGLALQKVKLPSDSVRGGVLTQAGVLKVTANGTTTSPVLRGVWVMENILGQPVPPPPPNTGGIEPDIRGATTIREQLDKHRHEESCMVCHVKIDPPGFALESFDPIGDFRTTYLRWVVHNEKEGYGSVKTGAPVDASGRLATGEPFTGIREFKKLILARSDAFAHCLTAKLLTFGLGREMGFSDREAIDLIVKQTTANGGGLRSLIHAIIESETFTTR
ncbi:MAG: hypothetical protein JWL59_3294 [Chthoniobacteraceae bacterium]|nr:hypothetical protein [Chthoniobacteraceae bacterium]